MGAMRRHLTALPAAGLAGLAGLVGVALPVAVSSPSYAAGCPAFRLADAQDATAVFDGRVTGPATPVRPGGAITYPVTVQSSYSGSARGAITLRLPAGPCQTRALKTGEDYIFLASRTDGRWTTAAATRSVLPYKETLNQRLHALLDQTAPPEVTFGEPLAGPPSSFTRVAAPGGAMIIVGLLGYVVVRRLGRRAA